MLKRFGLSPRLSKSIDRHFSYIMPLMVGVALVTLAVPRLITEVRVIPADSVLERIRKTPVEQLESPGNQKRLQEAVRGFEAASRIHDGNADLFADAAFAQLRQLDAIGVSTRDGQALLSEAISNLEASLRRNPANSFVWVRLSSALIYRDGKVTQDALEALRWSYRTGPLIEKLAYFRTDLGIRIYRDLDFDLKQSLSEEIEFFFQINWEARLDLMFLACKHDAAFIVQNAIAGILEPEELDEYYRNFMSPTACANSSRSNKSQQRSDRKLEDEAALLR